MYAFIHIPKTAGSTFRHMLRCSYGPRHLDLKPPLNKRESHEWLTAEDLNRARRVYRKPLGICGHRVTCFTDLAETEDSLKFFTFLREPLARFVSHFKHSRRTNMAGTTAYDFLKFCEDPHQQNVQCRWIGGIPCSDQAMSTIQKHIGFIGLTEQFDASVLMFNEWLGCHHFQPNYVPKNIHPLTLPFNPLKDVQLKNAAIEANQNDIRLYKKVVAEIFTKQSETYGEALSQDMENLRTHNQHYKDPGEPVLSRLKRNCVYKPLQHLGAA